MYSFAKKNIVLSLDPGLIIVLRITHFPCPPAQLGDTDDA